MDSKRKRISGLIDGFCTFAGSQLEIAQMLEGLRNEENRTGLPTPACLSERLTFEGRIILDLSLYSPFLLYPTYC